MARIHFLNVEEGDCTIIQHQDGKISMIDVCSADASEERLFTKALESESLTGGIKGNFHQKDHPTNPVDYLRDLRVTSIFRYIQTHPDMDHMDGLDAIASSFDIVNFWDTKNTKQTEFDAKGRQGKYKKADWDRYQTMRKSKLSPTALYFYDGNVNVYYAADDNGPKQDDYIQILSPTPELVTQANGDGKWNDCSYVILYHICGRKVLFMGDADMRTINHLLENHKDDITDIDVLIAPHHGRDSDKDFSFLDTMKPKLTLFGNVPNKDAAHAEWNNRGLLHITNNQAGNILLDISSLGIIVAVSNQTFANRMTQASVKHDALKYSLMDYWRLGTLKMKKHEG